MHRREFMKFAASSALVPAMSGLACAAQAGPGAGVPGAGGRSRPLELYKTSQTFDSTSAHPEWLGVLETRRISQNSAQQFQLSDFI